MQDWDHHFILVHAVIHYSSLTHTHTQYQNNDESIIYILLYTLLLCVVPVGSEKRDASALGNTF